MKNIEIAEKFQDYMVEIRRYLHENPELTGKEYNTVAYIRSKLDEMGMEYTEIENGGILAFLRGKEPGKTVLLRADCDALPIIEKDNLKGCRKVWSKNPGVMHACGHDGHTACLLGACRILQERQDEIKGTVIFLFERGEEGGDNIRYMFKYMEDNGIVPDSCFGLHTSPLLPTGTVCVNDHGVNASAMLFDITIEGKGGHGSRPDRSNSPIDCFTAIYNRLESIRLTKIDPYMPLTYTIGMLQAGVQANVIPQTLRFAGTMRTYDRETAGMVFHREFKKAVDGICAAYDCVPTYNRYTLPSLANINDTEYAAFAREVFALEFGADHVGQMEPSMGSESYAMYTKQWNGCFANLGVHCEEKGTGANGHNENYDLDEDCLKYGAACHASYALAFLHTDRSFSAGEKWSYKRILKELGRAEDLKEIYGE